MRRQAPDYSGAAPLEYLGRSERCRASTASLWPPARCLNSSPARF